ncbi:hypothetical protein [Pseudobacteroides cellulosolvens]|uniref:Uncharacterized protein n=1 Tax=Pseudobacteroides cellulosolvens ATCC 35603 = DSM 2933 TaxID=398512 RepID=A0A0L6JQE6_9FIRM|nr:hypothetical protein [Pseudobacteroides cellulosolvens]KNY27587.1 hypothetical protein Bccel_2858 [Pseudobacteroides cellulosolvens ATCC 35603 = DSM 2933]
MEISNYTQLPVEDKLKEILLSQAALDIIMLDKEDAWLRLTSYNKNYIDDIDMVKIDNGAGEHVYFLFAKNGTIIKGFDHESIMSPHANDECEIAKGIYDFVPDELLSLLDESIERDDVTFCIWKNPTDEFWKKGDVVFPKDYIEGDDGEDFLLGFIFCDARSWTDWAKDYYEEDGKQIQVDLVKEVYENKKITKELVGTLNPGREFESVLEELIEIGYLL